MPFGKAIPSATCRIVPSAVNRAMNPGAKFSPAIRSKPTIIDVDISTPVHNNLVQTNIAPLEERVKDTEILIDRCRAHLFHAAHLNFSTAAVFDSCERSFSAELLFDGVE